MPDNRFRQRDDGRWTVAEDGDREHHGTYESEEAARFATGLCDETLRQLWDRVAAAEGVEPDRAISLEMLVAATPRTTDDYEIHVNISPQHYSTRGPSPNIGYHVYLSTCEISEGGGIAFSAEKADVLADLDLLIERLREARRRVVELA